MTSRPSHAPALLEPGQTLGVIGMGVMGQTILKGLLNAKAIGPDQAWGTSRSAQTCKTVATALGVPVEPDAGHRLPSTAVVVLCVKPAQAAAALKTLAATGKLRPDTLLISIVAGVSSSTTRGRTRHGQSLGARHAQHALRRRRGHDGTGRR